MDRVLFLDDDGKICYVEPPDVKIHQIFDRALLDQYPSINRISCCEWCLWTINSDFQVCLYVYSRKSPIEAIEITYENQVRYCQD